MLKRDFENGFSAIPVVVILVAIAGVAFFVLGKSNGRLGVDYSDSNQIQQTGTSSGDYNFANPKKSAHYESNMPKHGAVLATPPVNIVIDFNFDLAPNSEIRVYSSGVKNPRTGTTSPVDITTGETVIDTNKLSMRRAINPEAADDKYTVEYNVCWPDGSCHDGSFEFAIDRSLQESYTDMTREDEVTINMQDIQFQPKDLLIKRGTKVTWVNNDIDTHYVNTDSHPAHSYYPRQNSQALEQGDEYSLVFDTIGAYPYHCSAHAQVMSGNIVVLE